MNNNCFTYTLNEVASWGSPDYTGNNPPIEIPILQRDLVWNETRMELLWDSVMRNIPISSFIAIKGLDNQSKYDNTNTKDKYFLLDGQQRANSISLAFRKFEECNKTILWLDIDPDDNTKAKDTQKKFFFKITTSAHPWGFQTTRNGDVNNIKLNIAKIRTKVNGAKRPSPYELYPLDANLPIPFYYFIKHHDIESYEVFCKMVINEIDTCKSEWAKVYKSKAIEFIKNNSHKFQETYRAIAQLKKYKLVTLIAPEELITKYSDDENENISDVSVLFERINILGVKPSNEELFYSVIKSFLPEAKEIDKLAKNRMLPYRMMMLALRTYFTINDNAEWSSNITIGKLKKIYNNDKNKWNDIVNFLLQGNFEKLLMKVDKLLGFGENNKKSEDWGILRFHRTSIAQSSIDIYQLLLLLANDSSNELDTKMVASLATYLHWCSVDKNKTANIIYKSVKSNNCNMLQKLQLGIAEAVRRDVLKLPIFSDELVDMFSKDNLKTENIILKYEYRTSIWNLFSNNEGKELLLYAVRNFMNKNEEFRDYDPANISMWKEYNRPWDYDHIIPQGWIKNKKVGQFRNKCNSYIGSIGNFAPLPFSTNRAKSDSRPEEVYKEIADDLLIDINRVSILPTNFFIDETNATNFINITQNRFIRIYENWLDGLEVEKLFKPFYFGKDNNIAKRKLIFDSIAKEMPDISFYVCEYDRDIKINQMKDADYCSKWLTIGKDFDEYFLAITSNCEVVEIGIRKISRNQTLSNKEILNKITNENKKNTAIHTEWWHTVTIKNINDTSIDDCVNEFIRLRGYF